MEGGDDEPAREVIARALIALELSLDLTVAAVGIETDGQRDLLRHFGCATGQGYLFSRPIQTDALADLARHTASVATP
jgi:EAL domain-containing protein (putative c-di-GMP-specific phosphodiesterase class I)